MQTCTIFSPLGDCDRLQATLVELAGAAQVSVEGDKVVARQRRLILQQRLEFQPVLPGVQLDDMRARLLHVYAALPTSNGAIRAALQQRIAQFRVAVVVTGKRLVGMEDLIFGVTKAMDGLVFWGGNELLDAKGKLVMSFAGKTGLAEFDGAKAGADLPPPPASAAAIARKAHTDALLKEHKVPLNPAGQPMVEEEICRTQAEVAGRALALLLVGLKGNRVADAPLRRLAESLDILPALSPSEREFWALAEPDEAACFAALWQMEGCWAALWALGWVEVLNFPDTPCVMGPHLKRIRAATDRASLLAEMTLRPTDELLDAIDQSARMYWAVKDSHLQRKDPPADMIPGVVFERQRFFHWLLHPGDWDAVATQL